MKDKTLLILAAGMGSRFGGLKQVEPIGPNGEFILDYSIYDAVRCGFNKIVFVIKEENYDLFKKSIGSRIEKYVDRNNIKIEYAFQDFKNVKDKYNIPESRIKPLGTAHAILCAKDKIDSPFLIINSDDFYGYDAFATAGNFIDIMKDNELGLVGYNVLNTLTENGSVKRGICNIKDGELDSIDESEITVSHDQIKAMSLVTGAYSTIDAEKKVSMNMIAFPNNFMNYIDKNFDDFLENSNLEKDEYLIPEVMSKGIKEKLYSVKVLDTDAKWVGITYKEDKEMVEFYINSLIDDNKYPKNLWKID